MMKKARLNKKLTVKRLKRKKRKRRAKRKKRKLRMFPILRVTKSDKKTMNPRQRMLILNHKLMIFSDVSMDGRSLLSINSPIISLLDMVLMKFMSIKFLESRHKS